MKFNYSIIQRMNIITKIYIEYNNENFVPSYRIAIFNDEISEIEGSKTNETFIKKRKNKTRSISQNIEELSNPPQKFEPKNHALITSDSISNRSTVPHFRVTEPFCDTFVSHRSLSFPSTPSTQRLDEKCGGAGTNRKQAIVAHGNPGPCFLGRLHPGLRFFPESIVFAKYDRGRNENYTPSPLPFSRQSRNALFPPLRFPPFARFSIFRPSPLSARGRSPLLWKSVAFPGRGERRISEKRE